MQSEEKKFIVNIASIPTRENVVAEVFFGSSQWVEISKEHEELVIQFYSPPDQPYWEFPFYEAIEALEKAKRRILGLEP